MPTAGVSRRLSPLETGLWRMDQAAPLNFATVAEISGPLDAAALRVALDATQSRHAHLRERIIVDDARRPAFTREGVAALPLRIAENDWLAEVEREINDAVPAEVGPLARCVLVPTREGSCRVILTLHHSIGDGMSGAYLMRDLIQSAGAAAEGLPADLAPLTDDTPLDDRVPPGGLAGLWAKLRFVLSELVHLLTRGTPVRMRRDRTVPCWERRTRLIHEVLDPDLSARLANRAREEGTTVHGALSAAITLGLVEDTGVKRGAHVVFGSPVNLRKDLSPPVADDVGFYVSMLAFHAVVRPDMRLWDLARAVRASLTADRERGTPAAVIGLLPLLFALIGGARTSPRTLAARWERMVPATTGLTNLGRLDVETTHGPLRIESLHFAAAPSALGDFLCTATSLHGRIFWNFLWPDPTLDADHATDLVRRIVARLRSAI